MAGSMSKSGKPVLVDDFMQPHLNFTGPQQFQPVREANGPDGVWWLKLPENVCITMEEKVKVIDMNVRVCCPKGWFARCSYPGPDHEHLKCCFGSVFDLAGNNTPVFCHLQMRENMKTVETNLPAGSNFCRVSFHRCGCGLKHCQVCQGVAFCYIPPSKNVETCHYVHYGADNVAPVKHEKGYYELKCPMDVEIPAGKAVPVDMDLLLVPSAFCTAVIFNPGLPRNVIGGTRVVHQTRTLTLMMFAPDGEDVKVGAGEVVAALRFETCSCDQCPACTGSNLCRYNGVKGLEPNHIYGEWVFYAQVDQEVPVGQIGFINLNADIQVPWGCVAEMQYPSVCWDSWGRERMGERKTLLAGRHSLNCLVIKNFSPAVVPTGPVKIRKGCVVATVRMMPIGGPELGVLQKVYF